MLYVGCFRQELLACQRRVRNERLPPPSCPQQHSHEDEESGHARSVTASPMAAPANRSQVLRNRAARCTMIDSYGQRRNSW